MSTNDYNAPASLNITFEANIFPNSISRCTSIEIVDDILVECAHSFSVRAGEPYCGTLNPINSTFENRSTTVTIDDNDGKNLVLYTMSTYTMHVYVNKYMYIFF